MTYQEFVNKYLNRDLIDRTIKYMLLNPQKVNMQYGIAKDPACGAVGCVAGTACLLMLTEEELGLLATAEETPLTSNDELKGYDLSFTNWRPVLDRAIGHFILVGAEEADWENFADLRAQLKALFMIHSNFMDDYSQLRFMLPATPEYTSLVIQHLKYFSKFGKVMAFVDEATITNGAAFLTGRNWRSY